MRALILTLLVTGTSAGHAQPECNEARLEYPQASLFALLKDALAKGVVTRENLNAFASASEWRNPFLTSSRHLLTPRFTLAFTTLEAKMSGDQRRRCQELLLEYIDERVQAERIARDARTATKQVLAPSLLTSIDLGPLSLAQEKLIPGTIDGKPAFLTAVYDSDRAIHMAVALDPFASGPDKLVRIEHGFQFDMQEATEERLERQMPAVWERGGRTFDFQRPLIRVNETPGKGLQFLRPDDSEIAHFALHSNEYLVDQDHYPKYFTIGERSFALFPCYDHLDHRTHIYAVDLATGLPAFHHLVETLNGSMGMVQFGGGVFLYYTEQSDPQLHFVNIADKSQFERSTQLRESEVIGEFQFRGQSYLAWPKNGKLAIHDIAADLTTYTPAELSGLFWRVTVFEYEGELYLIVVSDHTKVFQLTRSTRGGQR